MRCGGAKYQEPSASHEWTVKDTEEVMTASRAADYRDSMRARLEESLSRALDEARDPPLEDALLTALDEARGRMEGIRRERERSARLSAARAEERARGGGSTPTKRSESRMFAMFRCTGA